jgi:membrane-associated phospholipid phosphatase
MNILKNIDNVDKYLSSFIHNLELPRIVEYIIYTFARMFNPDLVTCYFVIMLIESVLDKDPFFVILPIKQTLAVFAFTTWLKKYTARPRPVKKDKLKRVRDLRQYELNHSMPSGDSAQAGNFALILFVNYDTMLGFYIVPFVMFARMFYFCHYLGDTIVGCISGMILSYVCYLFFNA